MVRKYTGAMPVQDDQWRSFSRWYDPYLSADRIARYLTESGESLAADFFTTQPDAAAQRWSLAEVYAFLAARGGDKRIPRLFPLAAERGPARLLHTRHVEIPEVGAKLDIDKDRGADLVVHTWDPCDGRGAVAIGYPVRESPAAVTKEAADRLLGMSGVSAVAVLTGFDAPIRVGYDTRQPGLWVADGRLTHEVDSVGISTERFGWGDLSNLLQTSLPYWPVGLRDRDAMLAWRPGDPPREVTVALSKCNPRALAKAVADPSPTVRDIIDRVTSHIESILIEICESHNERYAALPSLNVAAVPARPEPSSDITHGEAALLLHQRAHDQHSPTTLLIETIPVKTVVTSVRYVDPTGPLAELWLARLEAASAPQELGFRLLDHALNGSPDPVELLAHPSLPDSWIARQTDTVVHTIGTSVPATGRMVHAYVTRTSAFFRDSSGAIWPIPAPSSSPVEDPSRTLARTLTILSIDAGADVNDETHAINPTILARVQDGYPIDLHLESSTRPTK